MGVDTRIMLSPTTRLKDVVDVLNILVGNPQDWQDHGKSGWVTTHGIKAEPAGETLIECAKISGPSPITTPLYGETGTLYVLYHFETGTGHRLLMPRCTAFWIAVGHGLVDLFGGYLDYNDCDSIDVDYEQPSFWNVTPEDNEAWDDFQRAKASVEPLELATIMQYERFASYKVDGSRA